MTKPTEKTATPADPFDLPNPYLSPVIGSPEYHLNRSIAAAAMRGEDVDDEFLFIADESE